jgi:hypothetical protein
MHYEKHWNISTYPESENDMNNPGNRRKTIERAYEVGKETMSIQLIYDKHTLNI